MGELGRRVLLVDDELVLQKLISRYLASAGYAVLTANDGLDAIAKLRVVLPDLIISDLNMPRMPGREFLEVVRNRFPQIPVLAIGDEADDELPAGVAADAYFHKNRFGFHQLPEAIDNLNRRHTRRPDPPLMQNEIVAAKRDGNGHYIIHCADCLREFSIPRLFHIKGAQRWTSCTYCGKIIQFTAD